MRAVLIVVSIVLLAIWAIGLYLFDFGGLIHSFLIGALGLFFIRILFYKKVV
jgi:hypothetical protein